MTLSLGISIKERKKKNDLKKEEEDNVWILL
jgi:hypothetical protein